MKLLVPSSASQKEKYWRGDTHLWSQHLGDWLGLHGHPQFEVSKFEISLEYRRLYLKKERKDPASSPSVLERPSLQRRESMLEAISRYQMLNAKPSIAEDRCTEPPGQWVTGSGKIHWDSNVLCDASWLEQPPTWNAAISNLIAK